MRVAQLLLWLAAAVLLMRPLFRRRQIPTPPAARDELVKDPMCQTYVLRSRAVTRGASAGPTYFCSDACARRYHS